MVINTIHRLCSVGACASVRPCFARSVCQHWSVPIGVTCWQVFLLLLLRGARLRGKCQCKHSCCLRGRSFSHLSPPRTPQSGATASSVPPHLPCVIPFSCPRSTSPSPRPPSLPLPLDARLHIHILKHTHTPDPCFSRPMLTDYLFYCCQLVSGLKWIYIPLAAPQSKSIGLNSFNSNDICLLAYLLSRQALAQAAPLETVTLAFVHVGRQHLTPVHTETWS